MGRLFEVGQSQHVVLTSQPVFATWKLVRLVQVQFVLCFLEIPQKALWYLLGIKKLDLKCHFSKFKVYPTSIHCKGCSSDSTQKKKVGPWLLSSWTMGKQVFQAELRFLSETSTTSRSTKPMVLCHWPLSEGQRLGSCNKPWHPSDRFMGTLCQLDPIKNAAQKCCATDPLCKSLVKLMAQFRNICILSTISCQLYFLHLSSPTLFNQRWEHTTRQIELMLPPWPHCLDWPAGEGQAQFRWLFALCTERIWIPKYL